MVRGKTMRYCTECGMSRMRGGGKCGLSTRIPVKSVVCSKTGEEHIVRWAKFVCEGRMLKPDNPYWDDNLDPIESGGVVRKRKMNELRKLYNEEE